ncbi:ectoine/hydroxyectoine ABC transporter permease subunit EhuC [Nocardia cyriacigeorgica]|uniref:Ectoine/hydroxyectoine ABC transporter permease subunit EhuC n=2 Tax=Nocardia cyriacigeorgica TaxID=135487 RepID=A0A6P1CZC6_9NOCA|nr:ectoine/hydroxyectoine ABC transporter permease subunit EhuC [Nocardia cyriacigeorgica]NEW39300.1 ectoine/hydroxyectoine ABC transporter permease subunit EhuC [Nocardia cyriacigeorgica]NEW43228.1 ectoine/hydroxyectoine ABC transporter permease subunit EhuC [Nocardia cyriacigeorgica]NEW49805.1 ectoine/hydroxyectoine ABC transporter permease subunit EhuC [Nocardia cyriacigeorgica]NEW54540.1 ectoine/hydroxyectoine ABC transporter permease subunit EhuC [Nocardia cyriacigeorgica]
MTTMDSLREALPGIWDGIVVTLQLTLGGALLAFLIALVLGTVVRVRNLALRGTSRVLIEFFRGTSLLVQIFWLFYVLPLFGYQLEPVFCGILALGLNYGAYGAEVVRGALNAVPRTQWEAAVALNFSPWQRLHRVLFPQAWALMVPPLTNLLIHLLKGTAVASYITLQDLTFEINKLRQSTGDTLFSFGVGLVIYFVLAYVLTLVMNLVETRAKSKLGRGPTLKEMLRLAPDEPVEAVAR